MGDELGSGTDIDRLLVSSGLLTVHQFSPYSGATILWRYHTDFRPKPKRSPKIANFELSEIRYSTLGSLIRFLAGPARILFVSTQARKLRNTKYEASVHVDDPRCCWARSSGDD